MLTIFGKDGVEERLAEPVVVVEGKTRLRRSEGERAAIREMLSGFGGPLS